MNDYLVQVCLTPIAGIVVTAGLVWGMFAFAELAFSPPEDWIVLRWFKEDK